MALVSSSDPRVISHNPANMNMFNNRIERGTAVKISSTNALLSVPNSVAVEIAHEKPALWFTANPNHRPFVRIPKTTLSLQGLAPVVKSALENFKLTTEMALVYLKLFYETVKSEKLVSSWKSYDVVMGDVDAELTPMSLVEVLDGGTLDVASNTSEVVKEGETASLALYILAIYRILRTNHAEHSRLLQTRIHDLMKGYCQDGGSVTYTLDSVKQAYSGWLNIPHYLTMIAAFDMFMFKNKTHPFATMRIATVASRFRDCAGLTSIHHLSKVLSYQACAMVGFWCLTENIGDEFINTFSGQEEIDTQDSYFPYQVDLQLTPKSSYSTTVNPTLYYFIHAAGSLLASTRSSNAVMNLDVAVLPTTTLAIWVALIHSSSESYTRKIIGMDEEIVDDNDDEEDNDLAVGRPTNKDPRAWFNYLQDTGFKFEHADIVRFETMKKNLGDNLREGSIGSYMSKFSISTE